MLGFHRFKKRMRETLLKLDFSFDLVKDAICYLSPNFTRAFSKFNVSMN